ncbi:hypothetical protein D9M70_336210 [compost metagenome]
MQFAQVRAEQLQVGFQRFQFLAAGGLQQFADFLFQVVAELAQACLAGVGLLFQAGGFAGLRQAVAAVEQFRRAAEETAVVEDALQRAAGPGQFRVGRGVVAVAEVEALEFVLGDQQLAAQRGLFQQQQGGAGAQVGAGEPVAALLGRQGEPVLDLLLGNVHALADHFEHRLVAVAEGVEAVAEAQRFLRVVEHAGIGHAAVFQQFHHAVGGDAVEALQARVGHAAAQQLEGFHRAVVGDEVVVAVVAPVALRGALDQFGDFRAAQPERDRGEAAQFDLGVFLDHLRQRQDEQPRRVGAGQAVPAGQLQVADEGAVGQHQVAVEVQPAGRPARAARGADDDAQHGVAPARDQLVVGLGEQVVDLVDALRVELAQWLAGEVAAGVEVGVARWAVGALRALAEAFGVEPVERRAAAGVARVEEEVLHVHRDEFARVAQLVGVRAAQDEAVVRLALAVLAGVLRPAGEVEQARVVGEGEAAPGLDAALAGFTGASQRFPARAAAADQAGFGGRPQPRAVVQVGQFVEQGGEQFAAQGAVAAAGLLGCRAAVGERGEIAAAQGDGIGAQGAAHAVAGQVVAPFDADAAVQAFDECLGQPLQRLVQQLLAGAALRRGQALVLQVEAQGCVGAAGQQQGECRQPAAAGGSHRARMASASCWSEAWRASGSWSRR